MRISYAPPPSLWELILKDTYDKANEHQSKEDTMSHPLLAALIGSLESYEAGHIDSELLQFAVNATINTCFNKSMKDFLDKCERHGVMVIVDKNEVYLATTKGVVSIGRINF